MKNVLSNILIKAVIGLFVWPQYPTNLPSLDTPLAIIGVTIDEMLYRKQKGEGVDRYAIVVY